MRTPYLDELLRRLRLYDAEASIWYGPRVTGRISWCDSRADHPIVLSTSERELAEAVRLLGETCRDALGPDSSVEEAGYDILLVHLDEVLDTRHVLAPLRITAGGLEWPRRRR